MITSAVNDLEYRRFRTDIQYMQPPYQDVGASIMYTASPSNASEEEVGKFFGSGYPGDSGRICKDRHITVTDDQKVICSAAQEGAKTGIEWLNKLYEEDLIDPEVFT